MGRFNKYSGGVVTGRRAAKKYLLEVNLAGARFDLAIGALSGSMFA